MITLLMVIVVPFLKNEKAIIDVGSGVEYPVS